MNRFKILTAMAICCILSSCAIIKNSSVYCLPERVMYDERYWREIQEGSFVCVVGYKEEL